MTLITKDFFLDNFCTSSTDVFFPDELDLLIRIASDMIDFTCNNKISRLGGINSLPLNMQEKIKLAVCAQTAFLDRNGGLSSLDENFTARMSLGKFSYMHTSESLERKGFAISPLALSYLEATGLLYRGI